MKRIVIQRFKSLPLNYSVSACVRSALTSTNVQRLLTPALRSSIFIAPSEIDLSASASSAESNSPTSGSGSESMTIGPASAPRHSWTLIQAGRHVLASSFANRFPAACSVVPAGQTPQSSTDRRPFGPSPLISLLIVSNSSAGRSLFSNRLRRNVA